MSDTPTPEQAIALLAVPTHDEAVFDAALAALPQVDLLTHHLVYAGISARWILIPAGTCLVGALTELDNVCLAIGDITVTTDSGPKRFTGVQMVPAQRGAKRRGVAHSDTLWFCVNRTDATTVAQAEEEMTREAGNLQTRRALACAAPEVLQ
jgi:hypothetical protein